MINNISNINTTNKVLGAYRGQLDGTHLDQSQVRTRGTDKAQISPEGQEFRAVLEAVSKVPDIREERVAELQSKINSGQYHVSARDIAAKMLNEGWL